MPYEAPAATEAVAGVDPVALGVLLVEVADPLNDVVVPLTTAGLKNGGYEEQVALGDNAQVSSSQMLWS